MQALHKVISLTKINGSFPLFGNMLDSLIRVISGKAKKIHARYPFLGDGTYQPPVLSVLYLQVG